MSSKTINKTSQLVVLEDKILGYLKDMGLPATPSHDDFYFFRYGTTVVVIRLFEEDNNVFVRIASSLLKDFEVSIELMTKLLQFNTDVLFGAFLLFDDDTISFSTTLLGNRIGFEEFEFALRYVAKVSDDYDEILQDIAGGKKAIDILDESVLE